MGRDGRALRELRAYPFFAAGGDASDRAAGCRAADPAALAVALYQTRARLAPLDRLMADALAGGVAPDADAVPPRRAARGGGRLLPLAAHLAAEG